MAKFSFHLIANAHLDPVWLWDWREGLNEGITTVRSILDLMDERPDFTFVRGEAAIYQYVESNEPATFARIKKYVEEGRWDVVGGTYIQPDTNLPATEILARHFVRAQTYFRSRFGKVPRVAWVADSFGHSAGLPEILNKAGMTGFAFTRPDQNAMALENPAFWWESPSGAQVMGYRPLIGWYGTERDEINRRLDGLLEAAAKFPNRHVGCFYGVGNHGGGPTRRQLDDIGAWADRHPEVAFIHSGLHRLFQALAQEEKKVPGGKYPVHRGELNFCLRGCYASMAKFKFPYRRAEAELARAEATDSLIALRLERKPANLNGTWDSLLFNSFHDILPGSSVERAFEDQIAWIGGVRFEAQRAEANALTALGREVESSVPKPTGDGPTLVPHLVWNPHPHIYEGPIEIEASLDYRPIFAYTDKADQTPLELSGPDGKPVPFQEIRTEHSCFPQLAWRKRIVFWAQLPPMGWSVYLFGLGKEKPSGRVASPVGSTRSSTIRNGIFEIAARKGSRSLQILHRGKPWFAGGGISLIKLEDPWGAWGGMLEERESTHLSKVQERWKITETEVLESGPFRSAIWVRYAGAQSRLDLTFFLGREREAVDVQARLFWNERSSRLKMVFPVGEQARFEVPGGIADRGVCGEVPGGRWISVGNRFGFASDALYSYDLADGALRATIVRATRYANDVNTPPEKELWRPAADAGELKFRFLLTAQAALLPRLAKELEQPVVTQMISPHSGSLPRSASLFSIEPLNVQLLSLKPAENGAGWIIRLQETAGKTVSVKGKFLGKSVQFGTIRPWAIDTWRLMQKRNAWAVQPTNIAER